jgi:uncharacterized protein
MRIFLREITNQDTELSFTQEQKWVEEAVARADEKLEDDVPHPPSQKIRPIEAHISLHKVDEVIVASGNIKTHLQLICSRCTKHYPHVCDLHFSALYCKDPEMAGISYLRKTTDDKREAGRPAGQNKGFARHVHNSDEDKEIETGRDLDITYISSDFIDLADVFSEQLQLQVPFQPLCQEDCKGICPQCGADQNIGRCACAKLAKTGPFSILRDFK